MEASVFFLVGLNFAALLIFCLFLAFTGYHSGKVAGYSSGFSDGYKKGRDTQ